MWTILKYHRSEVSTPISIRSEEVCTISDCGEGKPQMTKKHKAFFYILYNFSQSFLIVFNAQSFVIFVIHSVDRLKT